MPQYFSGYAVPPPAATAIMTYSRYDGVPDVEEIYVVMSGGGTGVQVTTRTTGDYDTDPTLSPDGSQVAYLQDLSATARQLFISNTNGSGETVLDSTSSPVAPHWSPEGSKIVYRIGNQIFTINPDGTGKTDVTPSGMGFGGSIGPKRPTFNRDGTLIAFQVARTGGTDPEELWVMNSDGTSPVQVATLLNTSLNGVGFSWANTSDVLAYTLGGTSDDVRSVNADGTGDQTISDGGIGTGTNTGAFLSRSAWTADDSHVYAVRKGTSPTEWTVWSLASDGTDDQQLALPTDTSQSIGYGYPYVYGDRIYTIATDALWNLVSVALDGTDLQTHDGDNNVNVFPAMQANATGF